ncbi:MAG: hypothetical protein JST54_13215 [Deltaproteobacteria bacterium]|nr:hypothetical protein [Deltaproteobacteria bacterium]
MAQDVSDGIAGVPIMIAIRLLDEDCNPVTDASVDIWHTLPKGIYSGEAANLAFCTDNDADAIAHEYFRGVQYSDANGVVRFFSCYPGWYSSRTVHVHVTVRRGSGDYTGQTEFLTTQLIFDDTISTDIYAKVAAYARTSSRDTFNTNDSVFSASNYQDYLFDMTRMADGSLVCAKTLILRKSTSGAVCSVGGSGGPGDGGMGPPPLPDAG